MKIKETFEKLKNKNEKALIVYLTAGFPSMESFAGQLKQTAESGADIIEIGIPFSDPIADGPTIQASSQVGLENGADIPSILQSVQELNLEVPLVFMSYLNPLLAYGRDKLLKDMKASGITGLIIPDLPVDEADSWGEAAQKEHVDLIFLVTPTSSDERIQQITEASNGFVYCVSLTGTTGARTQLSVDVSGFLNRVRKTTAKPIAVGFGISEPEHIQKLKKDADGMIVGSRVIDAIGKGEDVGALIKKLKDATRN